MPDHQLTAERLDALHRYWQPLYKSLTTNRILKKAIDIQQIPAPTFDEEARARYIEKQFLAMRLRAVQRDAMHNVVGWLRPPDDGPAAPIMLISAHIDTVFPAKTDLSIRQEGTQVYGPGLGDNSLGVAALLLLAEIYAGLKQSWPVCVGFVANAREEGLGNLDGIRAVVETLPPERLVACIVVEGMALGRVYHAGIAVRRLKISTQAEGGHSWLHFGQPSAIHALTRICASISRIEPPQEPRTTYNIGLIEGGQSVNSIATQAACYLDLRSTTADGLARLETKVRQIVKRQRTPGVQVTVEVIGHRPAGALDPEHPLVQMALAAQRIVGIDPLLEQGSTDANILLARDIPAVVVGISRGGNAHRLDEYIETQPLRKGLWSLLLLSAATIDYATTRS